MLSGFYFTVCFGLVMNVIAVLIAFFSPGDFIVILYFLATYLSMFSFVFVIVFILTLLKLKDSFTLKKAFVIILAYGTVWLLLHLFPGGVTYSENWVPIYSSSLFIAANILFTFSFTIPVIYYSFRLRRLFKDANLKRKLSLFIFGITTLIIIVYGVLLYNTWQDPTFKTVWGVSVIVLLISSGLLIYYGIGRDL
ncbi:MAG: hypothetical protein KGD61_08945 [Candidatus Lokiarchaeota archaeon]|nr:hypothetical protein [Candidatus Lokiarchaeota archaeon]